MDSYIISALLTLTLTLTLPALLVAQPSFNNGPNSSPNFAGGFGGPSQGFGGGAAATPYYSQNQYINPYGAGVNTAAGYAGYHVNGNNYNTPYGYGNGYTTAYGNGGNAVSPQNIESLGEYGGQLLHS